MLACLDLQLFWKMGLLHEACDQELLYTQAHGEYEKRLREQRGARETKQRELSNLVRHLFNGKGVRQSCIPVGRKMRE